MRKFLITFLFFVVSTTSYGQSKKILFHTEYGNIKVLLYDFTPKHRDLILEAIHDSVYQDALFNRIIKDFVVQGGEHDVDIAAREKAFPMEPKPRLPAEFNTNAFHKIGALGAGRDDNLDKSSFLNQIYFVVGKPVTAAELKVLEEKKAFRFTKAQRKEYLNNGGLPRLDNDYTVFGEIYEGIAVIRYISQLKTNDLDYPLNPVHFHLSVINE